MASRATPSELLEKLRDATFDPYVSREARDALIMRLAPLIDIIEVVFTIQASRDPKDDKLLEAPSTDARTSSSPAIGIFSS